MTNEHTPKVGDVIMGRTVIAVDRNKLTFMPANELNLDDMPRVPSEAPIKPTTTSSDVHDAARLADLYAAKNAVRIGNYSVAYARLMDTGLATIASDWRLREYEFRDDFENLLNVAIKHHRSREGEE